MNKFFNRKILVACLLASLLPSLLAQSRISIDPKAPGPRDSLAAPPVSRLLQPNKTRAPTAAPTSQQRAAEYIVALVNSEPITNTDVQNRVDRLLESEADASRLPQTELARRVLERLVMERIQLQEAKDYGLKIDDAAVDAAERSVAQQNDVSPDELRRRITEAGISREQMRRELREQLAFAKLREREVEAKVKISDLDIDRYLQEQRANTKADGAAGEINLAHVLVAVPESASEAQVAALKRRADAIAARAGGGEDFAKLANETSDAPDRVNGGALGLRGPERYPPLFVQATQGLGVGGVAGPVRSGAGFHVLKVLVRNQAGGDNVVTQSRLRHILLRIDGARDEAAAIRQLADYKRQIQAGRTDFATLAREHSQDGSAKDGGELGWHATSDF
ncbi:MAG: peptidylprolyl isomerase, partial [Variovorax sp.]